MSSKVRHLFQRQNSSITSVKAILTSRRAFWQRLPNKVKDKLCITSTQLEDNLLGKGQATVTLRDNSQQQTQLWICFIFKSHFQYRTWISWNVPFTYIVIMLKNHRNRYKRKKCPISICTLRALLHRQPYPGLKKGQLIFGLQVYVILGASSRTVQLKQLPKSQNIFCKRSSALVSLQAFLEGFDPPYILCESSGNVSSFSLVKLGTDVPALKPSLVLIQWNLSLGVLPFS